MAANPNRDIELFAEAVQLSPPERVAFLDRVGVGDADLRRRIEALLTSNDRVGDFLEEPPTGSIRQTRAKVSAREKPGDRVGRYKLLEQIGEGGCGVVFLAEQQEPVCRRVALKVVKPGMDTKSVVARFEAERQALALMDHPNIAKIFDAGETESGRPFFVMELVRGTKITDYCDQHSLSTEERLRLLLQVCQAVQHAHQKGIIHRDIKPSNILVSTREDGAALPVVIDFGIAKAITNHQLTDQTYFTAVEMIIGTPAYMSPEQATLTSADVDTRSDIYSLGVLLYELLTGSTPFDTKELLRGGLDEIRRIIREQNPIRPSTRLIRLTAVDLTSVARHRQSEPPTLIRTIRGDLDWIVMKALEKERARRYETANGLAMDIRRYLGDEAILARPPSKLYRARKTISRNRLLFATAGTIALLVLVGLVVVSLALARERQASAKSQQVTKFLEDMLSAAGPSVARGRDASMLRDILDATAQRVGKELSQQPEVEAELRHMIGKLYDEVGQGDKAEEMARKALAIRRKKFGSDSLEAAESLNLLGLQFMAQHKLPEAERAHSEALAIRRGRLGWQNADTATSLNDLAAVYRDQRRLKEAETMALQALRLRRSINTNSLDVADSLRNLCMIQGYGGRWAEAEQTARQVLSMRRNLLPPDHQWVASALEDLAWALNAREKFEQAQSLEAEALTIRHHVLGDAHPDVPRNLNALGQLLGNRGDFQAADAVLKGVLSIQRKLFGEDNSATLETLSILAKMLQKEGKASEAESVWREALALWARKPGQNDNRDRLFALRGLGECLESQGKWSDAEAVWRDSLPWWRKRGGIQEEESMYTLRKLALALEAERKWPEAESIHREALAISRQKGDDESEALSDLEKLMRVLTAQKRFGEAHQLLERVLTPIVGKPASVNLLILRVNVMGRRGRWREAAADAALALQKQPTDHYRYHTLAVLLAMIGDRSGYEQVCKSLVTKFTDSTDPYVAERIAQDCLLLPNSGADLALMDKLADKAVATGGDTDGFPYFQACKAMTRYRLGDFSEALAWGDKAARSSTDFAQAKAYAVLAMAHWQLGQPTEAREALAKGEAWAPRISPEKGVEDLGEAWVAWLTARISLDEADRLIQAIDQNSEP